MLNLDLMLKGLKVAMEPSLQKYTGWNRKKFIPLDSKGICGSDSSVGQIHDIKSYRDLYVQIYIYIYIYIYI